MDDDFNPDDAIDLTPFVKDVQFGDVKPIDDYLFNLNGVKKLESFAIVATFLPNNVSICAVCQQPFVRNDPQPLICDGDRPIGLVCDPCAMAFVNIDND